MQTTAFQPAKLEVEGTQQFVPESVRAVCRPTVSMIFIQHGTRVLFVQPEKADGQQWIFPQGGIKVESLDEAFRREAYEELGILPEILSERVVLGQALNQLPPERQKQDKMLYFVAAELVSMSYVKPVSHENRACTFVSDEWELWNLMEQMAAQRSGKFYLMCDALNAAYDAGRLKWSCREMLEAARFAHVA